MFFGEKRMVSSREAVHRVMNFKPLGMESEERDCWCVFLGYERDTEHIAAHETIVRVLKGLKQRPEMEGN